MTKIIALILAVTVVVTIFGNDPKQEDIKNLGLPKQWDSGTVFTTTGSGSLHALTAEEYAQQSGKYFTTKSEAKEIVRAIDEVWALTQPDISVQAVYRDEIATLEWELAKAKQRKAALEDAMRVRNKWDSRAQIMRD